MKIREKTSNQHFLYKKELVANMEYEKIAYLLEYKVGESILGELYLTLKFRDADGKIVVMRMFDVDMTSAASKIYNMMEKLVRIEFSTNIYQGDVSCLLRAIDVVDDVVLKKEQFSGELDVSSEKDRIKDILEGHKEGYGVLHAKILALEEIVNKASRTSNGLYSDKAGSGLAFMDKVLKTLDVVIDEYEVREKAKLVYIFVESVRLVVDVRTMDELSTGKYRVVNGIEKYLGVIESNINLAEGHREEIEGLNEEIRIFVSVVLGIDKPKTYMSTVLSEISSAVYKSEKLKESLEELPKKGYKTVDGVMYWNI